MLNDNINIVKEINHFYNILIENDDIRDEVSSKITVIIDKIEEDKIEIKNELFSFLLFLQGYDTPDFDKEYLFGTEDLIIEFDKIKVFL